MSDVLKGAFLGVLPGSGVGLGACMVFFEEPPFFTGDTILIGGTLGAIGGLIWGDDFIDLIKDYWWWR